MKAKILFLLLTGCLLAFGAWFVHAPSPAQADAVPEKYRDTVHKGLEYLVKSQHKDGHWEGDDGKHPVAMTGLVGLALLMEKDKPTSRLDIVDARGKAKYLANIRRAADWLMEKSEAGRDGLIFSQHASERTRYMQGHGLATLFLAGACQIEDDDARRKKLVDVVTRAIRYLVKAQSTLGGWYHTSRTEGHDFDAIMPTVIQLQALQAAEHAGIPVPADAMSDARQYLEVALGKDDKAKPEQQSRPTEMAAALAARFNSTPFQNKKDERGEKWLKYCQTKIPVGSALKFGRDELVHYYYAQVVINLGRDNWSPYRTAMFDHLQGNQNKDGSWPAGDGLGVGPAYSTALWCTILQLDKRSHPSMEMLPMVTR